MEHLDRGHYVFDLNVEVPLKTVSEGSVIRANVYRPKIGDRCPVIVTYGPCMSKNYPSPPGQNHPELTPPSRWQRHSIFVVSSREEGSPP